MEERGPVTRSCSRLHGRGEKPLTGCKTPRESLLSPQSLQLDSFYGPARKLQRLNGRSKDNLRQIRQKGHAGAKPALSGLLGSIPVEVSCWRLPQDPLCSCRTGQTAGQSA
jgi:hypothetical protein